MSIDVATFRSLVEIEREDLPHEEQQIMDDATARILEARNQKDKVSPTELDALFDEVKIDRGLYPKESQQAGLAVGYGLQSFALRNIYALLCSDTSNNTSA